MNGNKRTTGEQRWVLALTSIGSALAVCGVLSLLGAFAGLGITGRRRTVAGQEPVTAPEPVRAGEFG